MRPLRLFTHAAKVFVLIRATTPRGSCPVPCNDAGCLFALYQCLFCLALANMQMLTPHARNTRIFCFRRRELPPPS
ncbi:hypothetical protein K523DRAFT_323494 [Schizophyllum commune Tattone D]|nr:hypothetical protein K523DRAFT_323494 [Schizophyllum commune Tattone D]